VNSDEVRDTWFLRSRRGYDASEVDDLLDRVAAEHDAGRAAGPLIENAKFQEKKKGYDIDAVDWFLDQLLLHPGHAERAGTSADPWRDLPVAQFTRGGVSDLAGQPRRFQQYFAEECRKAWRDFGQQPGVSLTFQWSGHLLLGSGLFRYELRTAEQQQTVASGDWFTDRIRVGQRRFARSKLSPKSWPALGEARALLWRDFEGHIAGGRTKYEMHAPIDTQRVDATGMPLLYTMGSAKGRRASARIGFPDQRWLRFLVRGTRRGNAIMTAVDQAGNKIARYRRVAGRAGVINKIEIIIHPDQKLTDELTLAIAISARWLYEYFDTSA
jgi:DivIVA domain-containing protein